MNRNDLEELHYITPIGNLASIMSRGIFSHKRSKKIQHDSVAMQEIQDRRKKKVVPRGQPLHDYVNLYLNARNKMLFRVLSQGQVQQNDLCILRVQSDILDLPNVVIADRNASSDYARFAPAPDGLQNVHRDLVFAEYWTHPDNPIEEWRHGSIMCAEVLVPEHVDPDFITGVYVSCSNAKTSVEALNLGISITVNAHLFFR
jgi:hypothetical protein